MDLALLPLLSSETLMEKFGSLTRKLDTGCWRWKGDKGLSGYPLFKCGPFWKYGISARHLAWVYQQEREMPDGVWVYSTCRNKWCVCPEHLFIYRAHSGRLVSSLQVKGVLAARIYGGVLDGHCEEVA